MNLSFFTYLSVLLTLLPVGVVLLVRARPNRLLWQVGLDIPAAVAIDLIFVLILARVLRLDAAILVARGAWFAVGCERAFTRRKQGRLAWPVGGWDAVAALSAAALGVYLSQRVSRPYRIGDHNWHDGLVPTIAAQRLPFVNVYDATSPFHYHVTGDVYGAIVRTLSGNVMSSALAIALVRDLSFALIAASITLIALGLAGSRRRLVAGVLASAMFLLHGPIAFRVMSPERINFHGYAYDSFLLASCRPHMALSGVLIVGFCGAVVAGLARPTENRTGRLFTLLVTTTILAISDEASLALLGIGLGFLWLLKPAALSKSRISGFLVLLSLVAAIALANVFFQGALVAGGSVDLIERVPARVPSISRSPDLPLSLELGKNVFFFELLPFGIGLAGIAVHGLRTRSRAQLALLAFAVVIVAVSMMLATTIKVNASSGENQRFFVAPMFAILLSCVWQEHETKRGSLASSLMWSALLLPAATTIFWLREQSARDLGGEVSANNPAMPENLYEIECRKSTGANFRDKPLHHYIESSQYFYYLSCKPGFAAGAVRAPWKVKLAPIHGTFDQLIEIDRNVPQGDPLDTICRSGPTGPNDYVCAEALRHPERCKPEGTRFVRCSLQPKERRELLGKSFNLQRPFGGF